LVEIWWQDIALGEEEWTVVRLVAQDVVEVQRRTCVLSRSV